MILQSLIWLGALAHSNTISKWSSHRTHKLSDCGIVSTDEKKGKCHEMLDNAQLIHITNLNSAGQILMNGCNALAVYII